MNETRLETQQKIEQAKNLPELILIHTGIQKSTDQLLAELEDKILAKALELLTKQEDRHWCNQDEFAFLIAGLNSEKKEKYKHLLTLATNTGIEDFEPLNIFWTKFSEQNIAQLQLSRNKAIVSSLLKESSAQSRINATRHTINHREKEQKNERNRRKKQITSEQPIPGIDKLPFKEIVTNLYELSLATLRCQHQQNQSIVLEIFKNSSFDKQYAGYNLFDLLKFTHLHHPDLQVRYQAQYVLEAFTALITYIPTKQTIQTKSPNNHESVIKGVILETIFDSHQTLPDDEKFAREIKSVGLNSMLAVMTGNVPAFHERPESFADQPLANEVIKFILEQKLLILKDKNVGGFVLPSGFASDHPENILITWRPNITHRNLVHIDRSMLSKLKTDMPHLLEVSDKPLEVVDMAAILAFLRPELDLNETITLKELKDQARGGMFPISKRGIQIDINEAKDKDQYLTKFGLQQITFKRSSDKNNLKVTLKLGTRTFSFEINENMETPALANLAEDERNWLERIVFSYLFAVKNRDLYQSANIVAPRDNHDQKITTDSADGEKRREASSGPHLYVLPYSYNPQDWADPNSVINQEVKEEFGYSLLELNLCFIQAQLHPEYLETLKDITLKRIIFSALKRLENKHMPENWTFQRAAKINNKIREAMLGAGIKEEQIKQIDAADNIALIGFKHEQSEPTEEPLKITLNGISNQLFAKP